MRHKKRKITLSIILILILIIPLGYEAYLSKYSLETAYYNIQSDKLEDSFTCVQLSDLHNSEFGEDNVELIEAVRSENPDLILITGDLIDSGEEDLALALNLLTALQDIAPVYVSLGNHELEYQEEYKIDLVERFAETGVTVLETDYQDIEVNGQSLRLAGMSGFYLPFLDEEDNEERATEFWDGLADTELYTILMCHMPVFWMRYLELDLWPMDCIFTGHLHGGQIILPGIGGVYAPDLGFFPGNLSGIGTYLDGNTVMILSRGLGSTEFLPRWNNHPQIVVTVIHP